MWQFLLCLLFLLSFGSACPLAAINFNKALQTRASLPFSAKVAANTWTLEFWALPTEIHQIDSQSQTSTAGTSGQNYVLEPPNGGNSDAYAGVSVGTNGVSVYEHANSYMPPLIVWQGTITAWTHISLVYYNKQPSLYINGTLVSTGPASTRANVYLDCQTIGGIYYGYFSGQMADFRVWKINRAPSDYGTRLHGREPYLYGYWKLDESGGSYAYDLTPAANHRNLVNGPSWAPGNPALCPRTCSRSTLYWNGGGYLSSALRTQANSFSIEFWAKPTRTTTVAAEASAGVTGTSGQVYIIGPAYISDMRGMGVALGTNAVQIYEHAANYMPTLLSYQANLSGWNHFGISYNNGVPSLYLNGALVRTGLLGQSERGVVLCSAGMLGGMNYGTYSGYMAEVRVWNSVRTGADYARYMYTNLTGSEAGLLAYWPLTQGSGVAYDVKGQDSKTLNSTFVTWATDPLPVNCPPVLPCASNPCANGGTCINQYDINNALINYYTCNCPPNWTGATCTIDVDECATNNAGCDKLTTCTNSIGSFSCGPCPAGYSGGAFTGCTDIDECPSGCDPLTQCSNSPGSYSCSACPTGYTGTGKTGCEDVNECLQNNGGCDSLSNCTNTVGSRTCGACPMGYTGNGYVGCTDIDECLSNNGNCDLLTTCTNQPGSRSCGPCPLGYSGTGESGCSDVDECEGSVCAEIATCYNRAGSFDCGPAWITGSLTIVKGPADWNSTNNVVLNDTQGGQILSLLLRSGSANTTVVSGLSFGTTANPLDYTCTALTKTAFNSTVANYTCQLPKGVGSRLVFTIQFCLSTDTCLFLTSQDSFSYPPINITSHTLRTMQNLDNVGAWSDQVDALTSLGDLVAFNGLNFINVTSRITVWHGPVDNPKRYTCQMNPTFTTPTTMVCLTQAGAKGANVFTVSAGGVEVTGTDVYNFPKIPEIESISGCPNDVRNGTFLCPTIGGVPITITGTSFYKPLGVLVNGKSCSVFADTNDNNDNNNTSNGNSTLVHQIICTLPSGAGLEQSVVVSSNEQFSAPSKLLSYAPPTITAIKGCSPSSVATSIIDCPTNTATYIDIYGDDFGLQGASVLVGSSSCSNVQHAPDAPNSHITCLLPNGTGLARPVLVIQQNGQISLSSATISYAQCRKGQKENGLDCEDCKVGTFSNVEAVSAQVCQPCEAGYYANATKMSSCLACPIGTYSSKSAGNCTSCSPGFFNGAPGQSQCLPCPVGRYAAGTNAAECTECPLGTFQNSTQSQFCYNCSKGAYNSLTAQVACLNCPVGTFSNSTGSQVCTPCPRGTSNNVTNAVECTACSAGYYASQEGSYSCSPCPPGSFINETGASSCTICGAGTIQPNSGKESCEECKPGEYMNTVGQVQCLPCPPGTYSNRTGFTQCQSCTPGYYALDLESSTCLECSSGRYSNSDAAKSCANCGPGTYATLNASTICQSCLPGLYQDDFVQVDCKECETGKAVSTPGSKSCIECVPGRFINATGSLSCDPCPPGTYQNMQGASTCAKCPVATYNPRSGEAQCSDCPPGTYANVTGSQQCTPCIPGYYQDKRGRSVCEVCAAGYFSLVNNSELCTACQLGFFTATNGSTLCSECEPGYYRDELGSTYCKSCGPGKFSFPQATICRDCEPGKVSEHPGSPSCTSCGDGFEPSATKQQCICSPGYFKDGDRCSLCPRGATCDMSGLTVQNISASEGYWRPNNESLVFYLCLQSEHCAGGMNSNCSAHRDGPLCALCEEGYQPSDYTSSCVSCPSKGNSIGVTIGLFMIIVVGLCLIYYLLIRSDRKAEMWIIQEVSQMRGETEESTNTSTNMKQTNTEPSKTIFTPTTMTSHDRLNQAFGFEDESTAHPNVAFFMVPTTEIRRAPNVLYAMKIVVGFFQISSNLSLLQTIPWPTVYKAFIAVFSFVNLQFIPWQSVGCVASINYYDKLLIFTLVPIIAGVLVLFFFGILRCLDRADLSDSNDRRLMRSLIRRRIYKIIMFTLFLIYPSMSRSILGFFVCKKVDGTWYLLSDFALHCYDAKWNQYLPLAVIMLLIYPLGIPAVFFYLLWSHRKTLESQKTKFKFGFLYEAYNQKVWWFELVDMAHKLLLTSILPFVTNGELPFALSLVTLYFVAILLITPYVRKFDDSLHLLVQVELALLLICGWVLERYDSYDLVIDILLSILLIAIHVALVGIFLHRVMLYLRSVIRNRQIKQAERYSERAEKDSSLHEAGEDASVREGTELVQLSHASGDHEKEKSQLNN